MNNPAAGSRIRSIRAFDRGVAPMSDVGRALIGFTDWLAAGMARRHGLVFAQSWMTLNNAC
jgi:hypothetical protein